MCFRKIFCVVAPRLPIEAGFGLAGRSEPGSSLVDLGREKNTQEECRGPKGEGQDGLFLSRGSMERRGP